MPSTTTCTRNSESTIILWFFSMTCTTDTLQYWHFAWKHSIWNATVSVLQFWIEDLKPHVLHHARDWVYTAFFHSDHAQQIQNLPEEILFSHFMTTLNDAFVWSMVDNLSFDLANFSQLPTPPDHHAEPSPCRYRCHNLTWFHLVFTSSNNESSERSSEQCSLPSSTDTRSPIPREADTSSSLHHDLCHHITPTTDQLLPEACDDVSSSFDEHFPTTPLDDDDVWTEEPVQDRCLCIHERTDEPNHQCSYPCPCDIITFQMDLLHSTPQMEQCSTMM